MEVKSEASDISDSDYATNSDINFCTFYYNAVKRLLDIENKANISYLYRYDRIFNKYYDIFCQVKVDLEDRDKTVIKLLKESFYYRLIYVYRNATLFSSAVAFHFRNVYKQNPTSIKRLQKKKLVKICSIGGCSAPDIVAIITVLKSVALKNDIELDFRVTIIDFDADWKNTCFKVLSGLKEFHEATWKINFIESNLKKTTTWTTTMLKAIQEADVLTFVRFYKSLHIKKNIITVLCNEMKTEAMLFILDRPFTKWIQFCFDIPNLGDFHLLHAEICDYHTLDIEAVKHFKTIYQEHFGDENHLKTNVSLNLFVCVWIKASTDIKKKPIGNLESIFQTNIEKFNPKQGFLSHNALTKWENLFRKSKEAAGWSNKSIKKFVQIQKGKRCNSFSKFIPLKKRVNSLQNQLFTEALEDDEEEISKRIEKLLGDYLIQKRQYSLLKKNAYFSSLSANNLCSISYKSEV